MLFGIVQQHGHEWQSGLYFEEYPDIPTREKGRFFKYRDQEMSKSMEDVVVNLSHEMITRTIVTTYDLPFKSEAYILLGEELWRISSVVDRPVKQQSAAVCKAYQKEKVIALRKVSNAVGLSR